MKKTLIVLLAILVLSTIAIFAFIPAHIKVSHAVSIHTTDKKAAKYLADTTLWQKWFPQKGDATVSAYNLDGVEFRLDSILYNAFKINMTYKGENAGSIMHLLSLKRDSLTLVWDSDLQTSYNPARRLQQYGFALQMKKGMSSILDSLSAFMDNTTNVYGVSIEHGKILDSTLLSTKVVFNNYPSDEQVYGLIGKLKNHSAKYDAKQVGNPMLNIMDEDGKYYTQVALPIDKDVPETREYAMKYMFRGNSLRTDVTGGHTAINKAMDALHQYKNDFSFVSPAIPFQSLVTNRLEETDSSKWKTIVFYPVK